MASSPFSHRVVAIGVSAVPQLQFPAKNARDFFHMFTGALGPPDIQAACLIDGQATHAAVSELFGAAVLTPPTYFIAYFSGAASPEGLQLMDGFLTSEVLASHLEHIESTAALLIFDVETPYSNVGHPQFPAWMDSLPLELPHVRIAVARAKAVGDGDSGHGNSRFTAAYVQALQESPGDLKRKDSPYVSDRKAFDAATDIIRRRWDEGDLPAESGLFGGVPLVRSEARRAIGTAQIERMVEGRGLSLRVEHVIEGRRHVPTLLHYILVDALGERIAEGTETVTPDGDQHTGRTLVRVSPKVLREHTIWGSMLDMGETISLRWRITLRDVFGHVLDRKIDRFEYKRDG